MLLPSVAPRLTRGPVLAMVVGAVVALLPLHANGAQVTEAINRARQAEQKASERNQAVEKQAQQATQDRTPPKTPPPAAGAPQPGTPVPANASRRPLLAPKLTGGDPANSKADAAGPGTHTIAKGETLWGIAQRYLNDPYLWPEIYRLNTDVVEDPRWIYPGEVLKLPGAIPPASVGVVAVASPSSAMPSAQPVEQEPEPPEGSTVFSAFRRVSGTSRRQTLVVRPAPIVRSGEYTSAPFATAVNGPAWSGKVLESLAGMAIAADRRERAVQLEEPVSITPPSGAPPQVGTRYLVIRPGPTVAGLGAMVIPTGVIEVTTIERGKAPVAQVKKVFDAIRTGQGLVPYERVRIDSAARPAAVSNGPLTSVVWMLADPVLPTLQAFIVLNPKGVGAVRPGDVFALLRSASVPLPGSAPVAPVGEEVIGTAQVVRVTPQGITAVLTGQTTGIRLGTPARRAARMP